MHLMICPLGHIPQQGTEETPGLWEIPWATDAVSNEHPLLSWGSELGARKTELRREDKVLRTGLPSAGCPPLPRLCPPLDWVLSPLFRKGIFLCSVVPSASQKMLPPLSWQTAGGGYLTASSPKTHSSIAMRSILPLGPLLSNQGDVIELEMGKK